MRTLSRAVILVVTLMLVPLGASAQAWEPTKTVEFIVPAGTGGGADQMARIVQSIIAKHNLMKQSLIPVNKSAGAGAEGFLAMKEAKGDPHKIVITLSNLFTTPLATGVPFNWKDLTPVSMLALDQFILWVHNDTPYKTAKEYVEAVKKAVGPHTAAILIEPLRPRLDVVTVADRPKRSIWRSIQFVLAHPQLRVLGCSAFVFVVAQHTFTFYLVTYLYEHCGLSIARAGFLLFLSQIVGAAVRLVSGGLGDRMPRMKLLGWTGLGMAVGSTATGLIGSETPFWAIALVVMGYGSMVISWNGTSQAEFAHLSPPGEAAATAAVQNAWAVSGAVFGPPLFAAIASAASYRAAFMAVAVCVFLIGIWQLFEARRASRPS